jgi:hypothetical protein
MRTGEGGGEGPPHAQLEQRKIGKIDLAAGVGS